jgi:3-dehydroquinate synthase
MGTGKSTVGRALAKRLDRRFIDTDSLVELTAGMSIRRIFRELGEPAFREMEARAVSKACALKGVVIAVGGGAVVSPATREALRLSCTVVLLTARPETILGRMGRPGDRPLLEGYDPDGTLSRIRELLRSRAAVYSECGDIVVDAERPVEQVVEDIVSRLPHGAAAGDLVPPQDHSRRHANRCIQVTIPSGSYRVYIGHGLLSDRSAAVPNPFKNVRRAFIVSNPIVSRLWLDDVRARLGEAGSAATAALVGDGEDHKNLLSVTRLYDALVGEEHDRDTVVVALGGGVVGDLAGFVAATFMRGLRFIQIPTTLLAQVDSSVGGKVAVNHPKGKNLIGAFHHPECVISDVGTLLTLPDRVFSEGVAEAIKTALVGGEGPFGFLEQNADRLKAREPAALQAMVGACVKIKAGIVSEDERDTGKRMTLNLGHTFAHALETACGYGTVSHGEAVAVGLCLATRLALMSGIADAGLLARVTDVLRHYGLPTDPAHLDRPPSPDEILKSMNLDKKRRLGRLRLVLPAAVGDVRVMEDIPRTMVERLLKS